VTCRRCSSLRTGKTLALMTGRALHCSCLQHRTVARTRTGLAWTVCRKHHTALVPVLTHTKALNMSLHTQMCRHVRSGQAKTAP
jgi:hypothetical protein